MEVSEQVVDALLEDGLSKSTQNGGTSPCLFQHSRKSSAMTGELPKIWTWGDLSEVLRMGMMKYDGQAGDFGLEVDWMRFARAGGQKLRLKPPVSVRGMPGLQAGRDARKRHKLHRSTVARPQFQRQNHVATVQRVVMSNTVLPPTVKTVASGACPATSACPRALAWPHPQTNCAEPNPNARPLGGGPGMEAWSPTATEPQAS